MHAPTEAAIASETGVTTFDFEATFRSDYSRIARAINRIIGDPARAEDLAVEAFWRLWRTPHDLLSTGTQQGQVRAVLAAMRPTDAELLLHRSDGLPYGEIAAALSLNPASVGTLLSRAKAAFRKEYVKRYGEQ